MKSGVITLVVFVILVCVVSVAASRWFKGFFKRRSWDTPSGPDVPHKAPVRLPQPPRLSLVLSAKSAWSKKPARRQEGSLRVLVQSWLTREDTSPQRRAQISWHGTIITGKARVIDGDTIEVSGNIRIRLAGLDAPESDQKAKNEHGWYNEGNQVSIKLNRMIDGKPVEVQVYDTDKYGRLVGTVLCEGKDMGEWLVHQGYAIAAYDDQYKHIEAEARRAQRGRWGAATIFDPRTWRWRRWNR